MSSTCIVRTAIRKRCLGLDVGLVVLVLVLVLIVRIWSCSHQWIRLTRDVRNLIFQIVNLPVETTQFWEIVAMPCKMSFLVSFATKVPLRYDCHRQKTRPVMLRLGTKQEDSVKQDQDSVRV